MCFCVRGKGSPSHAHIPSLDSMTLILMVQSFLSCLALVMRSIWDPIGYGLPNKNIKSFMTYHMSNINANVQHFCLISFMSQDPSVGLDTHSLV